MYLKIPKNFVSLIFSGGFWVAHIPLVRMVESKILAQFPVAHQVMFSLTLSLRFFTAFAYFVINLHLLFCCVMFILANGVVLRSYLNRFSFSSVSEIYPTFLVWDFACFLLEISIQLFFLFPFFVFWLFFFSSVDACIICIVSSHYYQSSPMLFLCSLLVVVSIHWRYLECWQILFLFLYWHIESVYVIPGI